MGPQNTKVFIFLEILRFSKKLIFISQKISEQIKLRYKTAS